MKKTLVAFALGTLIGMAIGPELAGAYPTDPGLESTRALQDIASTLKARESKDSVKETNRALQDISKTLKSIDSTLKRR